MSAPTPIVARLRTTLLLVAALVVTASRGALVAQDASAPDVQALRKQLADGEIGEEQARAAFNALPRVDWVSQRLAPALAQVESRVASGELSAEEAATIEDEMRANLQTMAFLMGVVGLSRDEARVRAAMETLGISREEAEAEIAARVQARAEGTPAERADEATTSAGAPVEARGGRPAGRPGEGEGSPARGEGRARGAAAGATKAVGASRRDAAADPLAFTLVPLAKAGVPRASIDDVRATIVKLAPIVRAQGPGVALPRALRDHLASLGLDDGQIKLVRALASRAATEIGAVGAFGRLGVSPEAFDAMHARLAGLGVPEDRLETVVSGTVHVARALDEGGPDVAIDAELRDTFAALGLSDDRIDELMAIVRDALATRETAEEAR